MLPNSAYSTDRNTATSPLLLLPPEVRNLVYRLVFAGLRYTYSYDIDGQVYVQLLPRTVHPLALLRVCRQTYAEAALVPISLTTFNICVDWQDMSYILSKELGHRRASITILETSVNRIFRIPLNVFPGLKFVRLRAGLMGGEQLWDLNKDWFTRTVKSDIAFEVEDYHGSIIRGWKQSDHQRGAC